MRAYFNSLDPAHRASAVVFAVLAFLLFLSALLAEVTGLLFQDALAVVVTATVLCLAVWLLILYAIELLDV